MFDRLTVGFMAGLVQGLIIRLCEPLPTVLKIITLFFTTTILFIVSSLVSTSEHKPCKLNGVEIDLNGASFDVEERDEKTYIGVSGISRSNAEKLVTFLKSCPSINVAVTKVEVDE